MLKFIYTSKDDIPEGLADHYEEANGKFVLKCEGAVPSARLDEFRENNVALKKQVEAFGKITPEKANELAAKQEEIESSKVKGDDEVKKLVDERVAKMREEFETERNGLTQRLQSTEEQLATRTIDAALIEAGNEFGLRATAHTDAVSRGRGIFKLEDGQPVAYKDGEKQYGKDGTPLTPKEFIASLSKEAPHLFEASEGGGGNGSGSGGPRGGVPAGGNPWQKETWNLTKQASILRENKDTARQLAAKAGVTIRV